MLESHCVRHTAFNSSIDWRIRIVTPCDVESDTLAQDSRTESPHLWRERRRSSIRNLYCGIIQTWLADPHFRHGL